MAELFEGGSAPRRPQKKGSVQSIVSTKDFFAQGRKSVTKNVSTDDDVDVVVLTDDEGEAAELDNNDYIKCKFCPKDMTLWSRTRRELHQDECKKKQLKSSKKLLKIPELAPSPPKKWEYTKENVKFAKLKEDEEANQRRKRPRSFAVVELAPRECQCEVLTTLQQRFLEKFQMKKSGNSENVEKEKERVTENAIQMKRMLKKNSRLEQLSLDLRKMMDDSEIGQSITLKCQDGNIECQRSFLKYRTTLLAKRQGSPSSIELDHRANLVKTWLVFVMSAQIEWGRDDREGLRRLADQYGPVGMVELLDVEEDVWRGSQDQKDSEEPEEEIRPQVSSSTLEHRAARTSSSTSIEQNPEIPEMSENPLTGFKSHVKSPEFRTPKTPKIARRSEKIVEVVEEDSFDHFEPPPPASQPAQPDSPNLIDSFDCFEPDQMVKTPGTSSSTSHVKKLVFGSNVRILKTTDVTPMPDFEKMDENELKERVKAIGQRPKGKKRMIEVLRMAYDTLHPQVNPDTPTLRPLPKSPDRGEAKKKKLPLRYRLSPPPPPRQPVAEAEVDDADKTLNDSDDRMDEMDAAMMICADGVEEEDEMEPSGSMTQKIGRDLGTLKKAFMEWIRRSENFELYNHVLSMQPVSLEEMLARLGKADGAASLIGKAKLAQILDSLSVTYQLPQKGGAGGARRIKKR